MPHGSEKGIELMQLPDTALLTVLQHLDGKSLNYISKTNKYFNIYMPVSGLKLTEHVAKERVLAIHEGDLESARRFKCVFFIHLETIVESTLYIYMLFVVLSGGLVGVNAGNCLDERQLSLTHVRPTSVFFYGPACPESYLVLDTDM